MRLPLISWRQKLILMSLLCLVVPSVITLILLGLYAKNELKTKAVEKAEQALEVAELYTSNIMQDMVNAFNSIQYDSETITDMRVAWNKYKQDGTGKVDFFSFRNLSEKLDRITFFGGQTYVTILLPNGLIFTNYSTYDNSLNFMYEEKWLKDMAAEPSNTTRWLGTQPNYVRSDADKYPNVVTIIRKFQLYNNGVSAYIILSKPEIQFRQIFARYEGDPALMLLDKNGTIVSHTDPSQIGKAAPVPAPPQGQYDRSEWNGTEYLTVGHALPFAGWSLLSLTPYEGVTSKIGSMFNRTFVLQIAFFLLFALLLLYFLNQWTKPVMRLARTASKVEKGFLDERSGVRGRHEVGFLGLAFDRMLDRIEDMIVQVEEEQTRKRMAELELLQAQINPHFLFNTLNSIRLQVILKGEEEIGGVIGSLSTLLRMTINRNNEFIPLHEEVATVEHYMQLMNFRHHENAALTVNLASDALLVSIPRFTLQPLVENAYIHGLRQKRGEIGITAWKQQQMLYIQIHDNGVGMAEDAMERFRSGAPMSGIGLKNVKERLQIIYGSLFEMEMASSPGAGLKIVLKIPLRGREEGRDVQSHTGG
ncbi:sensor histidine kinase [Cohnella nanjingensis]|uniref:histidine kinase n=1 Tax=Cohnella nanjingensis TaxID=1387779 RepID=A0A7X0VGJ6_9BACL|nr:histidine kinase [Cohnella nanjingensis]MBB6672413.1 histidine kinase [Cohnella nanjingensis]